MFWFHYVFLYLCLWYVITDTSYTRYIEALYVMYMLLEINKYTIIIIIVPKKLFIDCPNRIYWFFGHTTQFWFILKHFFNYVLQLFVLKNIWQCNMLCIHLYIGYTCADVILYINVNLFLRSCIVTFKEIEIFKRIYLNIFECNDMRDFFLN